MPTDYNTIADEYKKSKLQPWRLRVESYTLFELVGDLTDRSVLDLACGEGFHTRVLKQKGAGRVVGIDISAAMIDLARQEEARKPLGIEYIVQDVKQLDLGVSFDLVFAAYLLNYAVAKEELLEMCQAVARHLKPGCRFVTINNNPDYSGQSNAMRKYDFTREAKVDREGTPIVWRFFLEDRVFEITNYYLSVETHEWALRTAGLRDIRWHPPRVSPEGVAEFGEEYWSSFLETKPVICIECAK